MLDTCFMARLAGVSGGVVFLVDAATLPPHSKESELPLNRV
jgi:hypothetical protein